MKVHGNESELSALNCTLILLSKSVLATNRSFKNFVGSVTGVPAYPVVEQNTLYKGTAR